MPQHHKTLSAVFPIIIRNVNGSEEVLLLQRSNTGYMDGMWDFAGSGHVDKDESAIEALIRECKEELNIDVAYEDVHFVHLSHRLGADEDKTYYDMFFTVSNFKGEPCIAEPHKCSGLQWFSVNQLPESMVTPCRQAFHHYQNNVYYSEITR